MIRTHLEAGPRIWLAQWAILAPFYFTQNNCSTPSSAIHSYYRRRQRKDLDQKEQMRLDQLLNLSSEVQITYGLLQTFLSMVRERKHPDLPSWMEQAAKSGIPELGSFVTGIERDYDAVHAALRLPWSQGITEGKVNKLKTLKRAMYGRAGVPLLRQRLLHDA